MRAPHLPPARRPTAEVPRARLDHAPARLARPRVLLVASRPGLLHALHARLRPDYEVILARDGDEAMSRILRGTPFDVILSALSRAEAGDLVRDMRLHAPQQLSHTLRYRKGTVALVDAHAVAPSDPDDALVEQLTRHLEQS